MKGHRAPLLMVAALAISMLPSCEVEKTTQAIVPVNELTTIDEDEQQQVSGTEFPEATADVEFPEAMRGEWMMGPEPCYLPLNSDADGQLTITADKMYGYEDTYELISVTADPARRNTWSIITVEHLGDQPFEMKHAFILEGMKLIAKHGDEYKRCT